jgi:hypothetical protein
LVITGGDFGAGRTGALPEGSVLALFGTAKATAALTSPAKMAVDASGIEIDPASDVTRNFAPKRVRKTPRLGPMRKPATLAMLTNASRRPRCSPAAVRSPIVADATGVAAAANSPLRKRWT